MLDLLIISFVSSFYLCLELTHMTSFVSRIGLIEIFLKIAFYLTPHMTGTAGCFGFI